MAYYVCWVLDGAGIVGCAQPQNELVTFLQLIVALFYWCFVEPFQRHIRMAIHDGGVDCECHIEKKGAERKYKSLLYGVDIWIRCNVTGHTNGGFFLLLLCVDGWGRSFRGPGSSFNLVFELKNVCVL